MMGVDGEQLLVETPVYISTQLETTTTYRDGLSLVMLISTDI